MQGLCEQCVLTPCACAISMRNQPVHLSISATRCIALALSLTQGPSVPVASLLPQVLLRFNSQFHALANRITNLQYNVRFAIKRTGFVFMHEALQVAAGGAGAGLRRQLLLPPADARAVPGRDVQVRLCTACRHCHWG